MSDKIEMSEEELLFIKSLEEELNVTEYSELRRIISKYINYAKHIEEYYNNQQKRIELRDEEQNKKYNNLETKYQKAISEISELEYQLDKEKSRRTRK